MRIVDLASTTDPGRVRSNNEDAYLVDPPLFVVADGMGGAQAGEVAARLCIDVFRELGPRPRESAKDRLRRTIEEANRRILERSSTDPRTAGMGSTVTAALVDGSRVAFGHVGDSRAYLLRGGQLQQLSRDHTLVAELMRQGRLTAEEASAHPQRSVITRALGAGPRLEVDTWDMEGDAGDVFLVCSDGLTSLVADDVVAAGLSESPLEQALGTLVTAANAAGGDDNITALAFRLGAGEENGSGEATTSILDADTLSEADRVPVVASPPPTDDTLAGPVVTRPAPAQDTVVGRTLPRHLLDQAPRRRRPWRMVFAVVVPLVLAAGGVVAAVAGLRYAHFVGVDPKTGAVSVFQGVPVELGAGHKLYHLTLRSTVPAAVLPQRDRQRLFDHTLRSQADAVRIVRRLERAHR